MQNQIIASLRGDGLRPPIIDLINAQFLIKNQLRLNEILVSCNNPSARNVKQLEDSFARLTDTSKVAHLLNPDVFFNLVPCYYVEHDSIGRDSLKRQIRALLALITQQRDEQLNVFSGELYNGGDIGDRVILDGFVIEFESKKECMRIDATSGVYHLGGEVSSSDIRHKILLQLNHALTRLSVSSGNFYELVTKYTHRIAVRTAKTDATASEEVPWEIGRIRLLNAHLMSVQELIEALLHESIHNYLSAFEDVEYSFIDCNTYYNPELRPASLWSGNPLNAPAFIHAVFVYFALFNLIRLQIRAEPHIKDQLITRRNLFASGFLYPGEISHYVSYACSIDRRIAKCLDDMQAIVQHVVGVNQYEMAA